MESVPRIWAAVGLPIEGTVRLEGLVRAVTQFLCTSPEGASAVGFMLQELIRGGAMLDAVYSHFIGPKYANIAALWSAASELSAESEEAKLSVFALVGQILYFRVGRQVVARKIGRAEIGPDQAADQ